MPLRSCLRQAVFLGDLYPLTSHSLSEEVWLTYQLHRADMMAGGQKVVLIAKSNAPLLLLFVTSLCIRSGKPKRAAIFAELMRTIS